MSGASQGISVTKGEFACGLKQDRAFVNLRRDRQRKWQGCNELPRERMPGVEEYFFGSVAFNNSAVVQQGHAMTEGIY